MSQDQQYLLDYYLNLYNQTIRQIDLLHISLDEIRHNMDIISGILPPQPPQLQQPRHRNRQPTTSSTNAAYFEYYIPQTNDSDINSLLNLFQSLSATTPTDSSANNVLDLMPTVTRTLSYSNITNPVNTQCPILLENFTPSSEVIQILGCEHNFTPVGITAWFRRNSRCPICRYDVRLYHTNSSEPEATDATDVTELPGDSAARPVSVPVGRPNTRAAPSTFPHSNILQ